jgi:hypothetical protein
MNFSRVLLVPAAALGILACDDSTTVTLLPPGPVVVAEATVDGTMFVFNVPANFSETPGRLEASAHTALGNETLGVILEAPDVVGAAACTETGLADVGIEFTDIDGEYYYVPVGACSVTVTNPTGDGDDIVRVEFDNVIANGDGTAEVSVTGFLQIDELD